MFAAFRYTVEERSWHYICKEYLHFKGYLWRAGVVAEVNCSHLAARVTTNGRLWGSRWQRWPQMCAMLLAGNIEDNRGPLLYLYALFAFVSTSPSLLFRSIRVFYWPTPLEPPPSLWSLAIFAYLMAIMQTARAGLPPSRSLCKLNIQNTQPQSLGHTTQLHIAHFPLFQSSLFLKTFSLGLELRRSRRWRSI